MIDEIGYNLELLAFAEKISLAALETAKASCREKELAYEKARFMMEAGKIFAKQVQDRQVAGVTPPPQVQP